MKVFVYGTLMEGLPNSPLLASSEFLGVVEVKGFRLYDLGAFPAITPDPVNGGTVVGELYEVTDSALIRLDMLEGYYGEEENNFYDRVVVDTVSRAGEAMGEAYTYTMFEPTECGYPHLITDNTKGHGSCYLTYLANRDIQ